MSEIQEYRLRDTFGRLFSTRSGAFALGLFLFVFGLSVGVVTAIAIHEVFSVDASALCVGLGLFVPFMCGLILMADSRCARRQDWLIWGWISVILGIALVGIIFFCLEGGFPEP